MFCRKTCGYGLTKLGVHVIPASFALSSAHQAFGEQGALKDGNAEKAIRGVGAALAKAAAQFADDRIATAA